MDDVEVFFVANLNIIDKEKNEKGIGYMKKGSFLFLKNTVENLLLMTTQVNISKEIIP